MRNWFQLNARYVTAANAAGAPLPGPNDIVTHVRWCGSKLDKTVGERLVAFYNRVLPHLTYETLWVVMPLHCEKSKSYQTLQVRHAACVARFRGITSCHGSSCRSTWRVVPDAAAGAAAARVLEHRARTSLQRCARGCLFRAPVRVARGRQRSTPASSGGVSSPSTAAAATNRSTPPRDTQGTRLARRDHPPPPPPPPPPAQRNHRARLYPVPASCRTAFAQKVNHTVQVSCILSDLRFLFAAKRIVLSEKSTFSFWAAWLSEANEVGGQREATTCAPAATKPTTTRRGAPAERLPRTRRPRF